jgi:RimJ/RimL family protein N-acetyltransferase
VTKLVNLSGRHAADLATLADDDWDAVGFVDRAQRLRARRERETFAVLEGDRLVGLAMLGHDRSAPGHAELGYWIATRERGRGYATAAAEQAVTRAFGRLGLSVLFAHCADHNRASARVLAKIGFRLVGPSRDPAPDDAALGRYELTRAEWVRAATRGDSRRPPSASPTGSGGCGSSRPDPRR